MHDQKAKCDVLATLHASKDAWMIPNPWDIGSAQDLEKKGFKALATSSAACAYTMGLQDGEVTLADKLAYCRAMAANTRVPLSVDFEDGYSNNPSEVAANIAQLAQTGVAGCSIEDFSRSDQQVFDFNHSLERIEAACEAVAGMHMPFQLVARADGFLRQQYDLDEAIKRLQAFSKAGAHMLYVPGVNSLEMVQQVAANTDRPLNILSPFLPGASVAALGEAGATRISLGNVLLAKFRDQFIEGIDAMLASGAAS